MVGAYPHIDKLFLLKHYIELNKGYRVIARENGCSPGLIGKRIKEFGITSHKCIENYRHVDFDYLCKNYVNELKNIKQISIESNCPQHIVIKRIIKYKIKLRPTTDFICLWNQDADHQMDLIIGSLLGDAWIQNPRGFNARFSKEQKLEFKEYLNWHQQLLSGNIVSRFKQAPKTGPNGKIVNIKNGIKKLTSYHFYTAANSLFNSIRSDWYPLNKKIVPKNIFLNPRRLAIWHCDDGSRDPHDGRIFLNTQGFSIDDNEYLIKVIERDLCIKVNLILNRKLPTLYVKSEYRDEYMDLIRPYVPWKCMQYKLSPL